MSVREYSDSSQECNSQSANHQKVTKRRDEIADELECFAVWLSRAVLDGAFNDFMNFDERASLGIAASQIHSASIRLRASIKEDV